MNQAADGDDYTYERRSGVAVFNQTMQTQRVVDALGEYTVTTCAADLRTADQKAAAEMAELRGEIDRLRDLVQLVTAPLDVALRVDNLVDAVEYLTRRVQALEAK